MLFIFVDKCDECDYTVVVENKRGEKKKMTKDELSMVGFEIVAYSGDARSTFDYSLVIAPVVADLCTTPVALSAPPNSYQNNSQS